MHRLLFVCWLMVLPVFAQETDVLSTKDASVGAGDTAVNWSSLPELIELGSKENPAVRKAKAHWRAVIERIPQVRALPDPVVMVDYFGENVETRVGPQEWRVQVSQSFPWPGTLAQAGKVAVQEVRIAQVGFDMAVRDMIRDLSISYHELLYLDGAMTITEENLALMQHIEKVAATDYAKDKAQLQDLLKAQSQTAQLQYDLVLLRELKEVERAKVNGILGRPAETVLGKLLPEPVRWVKASVGDLEVLADEQQPELRMARQAVRKSEEMVALARKKNRPSITLSASYIETGAAQMPSDESGKDPWMVGIGLSLPIWLGRNLSRVREAEWNRTEAEEGVAVQQNRLHSDLRSVYFRLENARRLIELYDQSLIPQATQAMAIAEQWNDGEVRDISGFLETQSMWLNFNLARLRAVTDYQQYRARLDRLVNGLPMDGAADGWGW